MSPKSSSGVSLCSLHTHGRTEGLEEGSIAICNLIENELKLSPDMLYEILLDQAESGRSFMKLVHDFRDSSKWLNFLTC
jgi:hypothetical protein